MRNYLLSRDKFPTTHCSSPVIRVRTVLLNPVEVAVVLLAEKTADLLDEIEVASAGPDGGASQMFTQKLSGMIDAPMSGGIENYAPLFSGAFRESHPELAEDLEAESPPGSGLRPKSGLIKNALVLALSLHASILQRGVAVHAVKCESRMIPFHAHIVEKLATLLNRLAMWGARPQ